jgi:glutamine amidotransferase
VVDTGSGNLRSVYKALALAGGTPVITSEPDVVAKADKIVVPGQGTFGGCMAGLERDGGGLRQALLETVKRGTPYLGICLGLQVLFDASEEAPDVPGLGLVPGEVVRFRVPPPLKIPHMGWNACSRGPAASYASILADTPDETWFYFVHSYYPAPALAAEVALHTWHGHTICAAVARDNIFACQFHPEKSQQAGHALLSRFVHKS